MKTLVIHPTDPTTNFLKLVYKGQDCTVINDIVSKAALKKAIKEHDRIIMLGHGTADGLLVASTPSGGGWDTGMFSSVRMVLDSTLVYLLKEKKNSVFVWCYAKEFVEKYELNGFATGMIVSEPVEALFLSLPEDEKPILESNILFTDCLRKSIYLDPLLILPTMQALYQADNNAIVNFNKQNLYYFK